MQAAFALRHSFCARLRCLTGIYIETVRSLRLPSGGFIAWTTFCYQRCSDLCRQELTDDKSELVVEALKQGRSRRGCDSR
jgi:hypothetical protein